MCDHVYSTPANFSTETQGTERGVATHLEVIVREEEHLPQTVIQDLGLLLHDHIFVVQRLDQLWLCLEDQRKVPVTQMLLETDRPFRLLIRDESYTATPGWATLSVWALGGFS